MMPERLIDLDKTVKKSPKMWDMEFDPLAPSVYQQQHSEDSLFSSGNSNFSTSPDAHQAPQPSGQFTSISPRQSFSQISDGHHPSSPSSSSFRPRYRPGSSHSSVKSSVSASSLHRQGSGPLPGTASSLKMSNKQTSHSPTGSVQSLPQYPTYGNEWDLSFYSDSSATGSIQGSSQDITNLDFDNYDFNLNSVAAVYGKIQWT